MLADRVAELGGADILVNNAGVIKDALLPFMKEEDWDYVLDTDLKGAFRVTKALLRPMLHRGWGRIVNIVSVSGISGHAGQANYSAAKGGLIAMSKALALELAKRGITVNAVAPGLIATEIIAHLKEGEVQEFVGRIPMGRFGNSGGDRLRRRIPRLRARVLRHGPGLARGRRDGLTRPVRRL